MPYVLTADQVGSRTSRDRVDSALRRLADVPTALPFTRTIGDELQGMPRDAVSVAAAILLLMRDNSWHIGVGIGPVETPLPDDTRAARGPAFLAARAAVEDAKGAPARLRVVATTPAATEGRDAEVVLHLLGALWERRTPEGWHAVDLVAAGHTQAEAASRLGITRQAVGQRLSAAQWSLEQEALPVIERLLERADRRATER